MELTLPNGWHEAKPQGPQTKIVAVDRKGGRVAVRTYSKEDFKDMKAVAGFSATQAKLVENPEHKFQDADVNGKPAVRLEVEGTEPNGMKRGFIITVFEHGSEYIDVVASTRASNFAKDSALLSGFAKLIVFGASPPSTAAPSASNPSPAPAPAAPATASSNTPKPQPPQPGRH